MARAERLSSVTQILETLGRLGAEARPRGKPRSDTVAVLDIGASKTVCLIGQRDANFDVRVLGHGFGVSGARKAALRGGTIADLDATESGVRSAIEKAERAAGVTVQSVAVNLSSRTLGSRHVNLSMKFAGGEITERDCARLVRAAFARIGGAGPAQDREQAIVHALPLSWSLDQAGGIADPRGMFGRELGVDMHFVLAEMGALRNLAHCLERCHLRLHGVTASPYAAGLGVLTEDELDLGCILIDIGGGVTTQAVFRDGALLSVCALGVGGRTLTNDIARGLSTPLEAAERIKSIYGSALLGADDHEVLVPCPPMASDDELDHAPRSRLTHIVRARLEETFEILRGRLLRAGLDDYAGRRVVLTGGGAQITGARELAEVVFERRARVGSPTYMQGLRSTLARPDFAVAAGLLRAAFSERRDEVRGAPDLSGRLHRRTATSAHPVARSWQWLRENF